MTRTLAGDAHSGVHAFGKRGKLEPTLCSRFRSRSQTSESLLLAPEFEVGLVERSGHLVVLFTGRFLVLRLVVQLVSTGHQIVSGQTHLCITQVSLDRLCSPSNLGLASQRFELPTQFRGEVTEASEIGLHGIEFAHRFFLAAAMFEDSRGFFDEGASIFGTGFEDRGEPSLPDDDMHFAADAGVAEQFLDVHQTAGRAVDLVLPPAPSRNIRRVIDTSEYSIGSAPVGVVDGQGHLARPSGARPEVPAKMTSSILPPRRALAPCSPITQVNASTTLDLPEPFGPTTQVIPGSNRRVVADAKDLNPLSVRLLRCMGGETLPPNRSAFDEPCQVAPGGVPAVDHEIHRAWGSTRAQQLHQSLQLRAFALRHDEHSTVTLIGRISDQSEFECAGLVHHRNPTLERIREPTPSTAQALLQPWRSARHTFETVNVTQESGGVERVGIPARSGAELDRRCERQTRGDLTRRSRIRIDANNFAACIECDVQRAVRSDGQIVRHVCRTEPGERDRSHRPAQIVCVEDVDGGDHVEGRAHVDRRTGACEAVDGAEVFTNDRTASVTVDDREPPAW